MNKVFIIAAKRTAIGSFMGTLKDQNPVDMGATVLREIVKNIKIDPSEIDEVIIGNVLSAGLSQGVGRQVAIKANIPNTVPGYSLNMVCGSGMKALMNGFTSIRSGMQNLVVTGGIENMSNAPYLLPGKFRSGQKMGDFFGTDHMIFDALTDAFEGYHMGITAENICRKYRLTRASLDEFAEESQRRALKAIKSGRFSDEIVPYEVKTRKGSIMFKTDEYPREDTSEEILRGLKPAFEKEGKVTAGNSSGINDGAAIILIASEQFVKKQKLTPIAEVVGIGQCGIDPAVMGLGPTTAVANALKNAQCSLNDMDLLELNEAFAAQSLGVIHELSEKYNVNENWIKERTNVNGGAIALGHPVGVSGSRIIITLVHEMKKRKVDYGLASLCIGGGMGTAVVIKNIKESTVHS